MKMKTKMLTSAILVILSLAIIGTYPNGEVAPISHSTNRGFEIQTIQRVVTPAVPIEVTKNQCPPEKTEQTSTQNESFYEVTTEQINATLEISIGKQELIQNSPT